MASTRRLRALLSGLGGPAAPCGAVTLVGAAGDSTPVLARPEPGRDTAAHPFERVTASADWQNRDSQGEVAFDGKLWILGGWYESFASPPRDVWSSSTGESWDLVTDEAGWRHSDFPMTAVFKDRIFIMVPASPPPPPRPRAPSRKSLPPPPRVRLPRPIPATRPTPRR